MTYCPKCGSNIPDPNAQFCPNCGATITPASAAGSPTIPPPPPTWAPPSGGMPAAFSPVDRSALGDLKTFALLGIIGIILSVIGLFAGGFGGFMTAGSSSVGTAIGTTAATGVLGIIGLIIGIVALLKVRAAFKNLTTIDREFSTPAKLVLVFFIGLIFFILLFVAGIALVFAASASGATSGSVLAGLAAVGLFAVLGIICFIVGAIGVILGLWRAGNRYGEDMIKIGGILYIIPVVDIAAPILVYIGVNNAIKKLPTTV
jgi:Protein of unknown function (DUF973)/zinc-ribbon domain